MGWLCTSPITSYQHYIKQISTQYKNFCSNTEPGWYSHSVSYYLCYINEKLTHFLSLNDYYNNYIIKSYINWHKSTVWWVSLWLLQGRGQGSHDGSGWQCNGDVVVFTDGAWTLTRCSITTYRHSLIHHLNPVSFLNMYEFTGRPVAEASIKILAHLEGVQ